MSIEAYLAKHLLLGDRCEQCEHHFTLQSAKMWCDFEEIPPRGWFCNQFYYIDHPLKYRFNRV